LVSLKRGRGRPPGSKNRKSAKNRKTEEVAFPIGF
jgi:hypothetical protein